MSVTVPAATVVVPSADPTMQQKHQLTELDLFKLCIKHPRYTKIIMEKYTDLKEKMRVFRKVWSGVTKYLKN